MHCCQQMRPICMARLQSTQLDIPRNKMNECFARVSVNNFDSHVIKYLIILQSDGFNSCITRIKCEAQNARTVLR